MRLVWTNVHPEYARGLWRFSKRPFILSESISEKTLSKLPDKIRMALVVYPDCHTDQTQ